MASLCKGGNEPPGSLKANYVVRINNRKNHKIVTIDHENFKIHQNLTHCPVRY